MKKILLLLVIFLLGEIRLMAQEAFFPTKEGAVLLYDCCDNGKLEYLVRYTVTKVSREEGNLNVTYQSEMLEPTKKQNLVLKEDVAVSQQGDISYLDMRDFLIMPDLSKSLSSGPATSPPPGSGATTKVGKNSTITTSASVSLNDAKIRKIDIDGGKIEMPLNIQPGDTLSVADMKVNWKTRTMLTPMKVTVQVTNRKVEDMEEVTVKAGTFTCYRVSCDAKINSTGVIAVGKNVTHYTYWYAKGIGMVKMESKGTVTKSMELTETTGL